MHFLNLYNCLAIFEPLSKMMLPSSKFQLNVFSGVGNTVTFFRNSHNMKMFITEVTILILDLDLDSFLQNNAT